MAPAKEGNLVDKAFRILRKKILVNEIKPGEYLDEKDLIKELGIGRTPLRQAIILLKRENLVEGQPHKTPYVKEFSLAEVKELFETLVIVEKNVNYLASQRINETDLVKISKLHDEMEQAFKNKDSLAINDLNLQFHMAISEAGKNRYLSNIHKNIRVQADRLSYMAVSREFGNARSLEEHNKKILKHHSTIIKGLERHDSTLTEKITIEHIRLFQNRIIRSFMDIDYI